VPNVVTLNATADTIECATALIKFMMKQEELVEDYLSGMTFTALRTKYKVGNQTIQRTIHTQGYPFKYTPAGEETPEQRKQVIQLSLEGVSRQRIAREVGVTRESVDYIYKKYQARQRKAIRIDRLLRREQERLGLK
jgi:DNA-binding NarL/FixJ family response regulator